LKGHGVTVEIVPSVARMGAGLPPRDSPADSGTPDGEICLRTQLTIAPRRIVRAKPHISAAECFALSLAKLAARKVIERELLESIFDRAEEASLEGETPTDATRDIRNLWDRIAGDG
jgi:hypothetical protein